MKQNQKIKVVVGVLLFLAISIFISSLYIENKQSTYASAIKLKIAQQETKLAALSELADRDGADAVVQQIVRDCSPEDRNRFDVLLGTLSQLTFSELSEIEQLFKACGSYYAERKAIVVNRLSRENEVYREYIELLSLISNKPETVVQKSEKWQELVVQEKERAELSYTLVTLQGKIIAALLNNLQSSSLEIKAMLEEAQDAKDSLNYLNNTIDILRKDVIDVAV